MQTYHRWSLALVACYAGLIALFLVALILYGVGLFIPAIIGIGATGGILHDGIE